MAALPFCQVTLRAAKPVDAGYPSHPKTLGERLKKRRLDLGLLQREAALQLGVSESTVHHWELSKTIPAVRFMPALIRFLGAEPATVA